MNEAMFPILAPFEFEKFPDADRVGIARAKNWYYSIIYSALYVSIVFCLQAYMKARPAFNLQLPLILWNLGMVIVNTIGTCRMIPGYLHVVFDFNYAFSLCDRTYGVGMDVSLFWGNVYSRLKILEFGDTIFIVLRKRRLTFLHLYHHSLTLVATEYSIANRIPVGHGFIIANYFIHSFMYSYYAATTMRIKVPRAVPMSITTLQILQMVWCIIQCGFAFYYRATLSSCYFPLTPLIVDILMYFSYFLLFCNFFIRKYLKPPKESKKVL